MPPRTANKCTANPGRPSLHQFGPVLSAIITIPEVAARARGGQRPAARVDTLIDTGAGSTCISAKVAGQLSLRPIGTCIVGGAYGHPEERNLYSVNFTFENSGFEFADIQVSESDLHACPYEMLVGRDILSICHFTYDGFTGQFTLEVPSPRSPDHPSSVAKRKNEIQQAELGKKKGKSRKRMDVAKKSRTKNR